MNRTVFHVTVVTALLALGGCVSMHEAPKGDAPVSTLDFHDRYGGAGRGNFYLWHSTPTCEKVAGEGRIAALDWLNGNEKQARVVPGQRRYLLAHRQALADVASEAGGGTTFTSAVCRKLVSFVPEAGHIYSIEMGDLPQCELAVVDRATGQSPTTLETHEISGRCEQRDL